MNGELEASLLGATLGALLGALAGGLVSHFSERAHESRRRRLMLLDQFGDLSIEFGADVHVYWSVTGPDAALQSRIVSGINKIRVKLTQLGIDPATDSEVRLLMKELYQFATGGTFATKAHVPDPDRPRSVQARLDVLASKVASFGAGT